METRFVHWSKTRTQNLKTMQRSFSFRPLQMLPRLWAVAIVFGLFCLPLILNIGLGLMRDLPRWTPFAPSGDIAPFFTPQVQYWSVELGQWGTSYGVDPNLLATIMQIESCGHPTVSSPAGAQGLFQVMPFHFDAGEDMLAPEVNVLRSVLFIHECKQYAGDDVGLTLACYNGGPSVTWREYANWPAETQRYYTWGTGIYQDAAQNASHSAVLDEWLAAGGNHLCNRASVALEQTLD